MADPDEEMDFDWEPDEDYLEFLRTCPDIEPREPDQTEEERSKRSQERIQQTESYLRELEEIASKEPLAYIEAIRIAFLYRQHFEVPEWAIRSFLLALGRAERAEFRSWDQIFGRPPTQGKYKRFWRDVRAQSQIKEMVREAHANGRPIDDELFTQIGSTLGIGAKTRVKELYSASIIDFARLRLSRE